MSYSIQYKAESLDDLEQLDRQIQSRIIKKIIWWGSIERKEIYASI